MNQTGKIHRYFLVGLIVFIPIAVYFLFSAQIRRRFLFEFIRQVFLVIPAILLAVFLMYRRFTFRVAWFRTRLRDRHAGYLYIIGVIFVMAVSAFVFLFFPIEVEDEDEYLFTARLFRSGQVTATIPPCGPFFLSANFVMANGKWYGIHPPGHPLLLVIPVVLGNARIWASFMWAGTILLCYRIFRQSFRVPVAFLGALLILLSPMFLVMSGTLLSENSSLFIYSLFLLCFFKLDRNGTNYPVYAMYACLFCLGMVTRPLSFLAVSAPFMVYMVLKQCRNWKVIILFSTVFILFSCLFIYFNYSVTRAWFELPLSQYQGGDGLGWRRGLTPVQAFRNVGLNVFTLGLWYLGNPIILMVPILYVLRGNKTVHDWLFIFSILLLIISPFFYWHPGSLHTLPRRLFEGLIPITFLFLKGINHFSESGNERIGTGSRQNLIAWFVTFCLVMNLITFLPGRLAIFRTFAKEAREPYNMVFGAITAKSIILVSPDDWKFGYPRNRPDFLNQEEHLFLRDLGPVENARLLDCFPEYATYRLMYNYETFQWLLQVFNIEHRDHD